MKVLISMEINKDMEKIIRYFDLELSETEMDRFHERMDEDPDFKKGVEDYYEANMIVDSILPENPIVLNKVKAADQSKTPVLKYGLLFALGVILLAVIFYLFINKTVDSEQRVYAELETYVENISKNDMRGDEMDKDGFWLTCREISKLDNDNKNAAAKQKLLILLEQDINENHKEIVQWWLAKIHMEEKEMEESIKILKGIRNNKDYNSSLKAGEMLDEMNIN